MKYQFLNWDKLKAFTQLTEFTFFKLGFVLIPIAANLLLILRDVVVLNLNLKFFLMFLACSAALLGKVLFHFLCPPLIKKFKDAEDLFATQAKLLLLQKNAEGSIFPTLEPHPDDPQLETITSDEFVKAELFDMIAKSVVGSTTSLPALKMRWDEIKSDPCTLKQRLLISSLFLTGILMCVYLTAERVANVYLATLQN